MAIQHLKKMRSMCKALSVDEAVDKIKGPAKVNEVIPEVAHEDRSKVFNQLRMEKATALEKQAQPMGGALPGREMSPGTVQTSAQTAGGKMAMSISKDAEEDKEESFFDNEMKDLKKNGKYKKLADLLEKYAKSAEQEGAVEKAHGLYKSALKYYEKSYKSTEVEDFNKSAEHAKKPAFPQKPKEGAIAGVTPESDVVGDYSKRMESQKTINDKPSAKQGFGSAEKLKKARALLKKNNVIKTI